MQFLDIDRDAIACICSYLDLIDLTMISATCTDLRWLYPSVELKQRARAVKVFSDIRAIKYTILPQRYHYEHGSTRSMPKYNVKYSYSTIGSLKVGYEFPPDPRFDLSLECPHDGGYLCVDRYRVFRTRVDSTMWYRKGVIGSNGRIERRHFPKSRYHISVMVAEDYTQVIHISDSLNPPAGYNYPAFCPIWSQEFLEYRRSIAP